MTKRVLLACLAALAFCSEASAITFTSVQFDVTAVAVTDGPVGFDQQSSPPSSAPVAASADSVGTTDIATVGAIGALGFLTTSADVSGGSSGIANAVATSHFLGSFIMGAGEPLLHLEFTPSSFAIGSGIADTSLFVSLTSDGTQLFQGFVGPGQFNYVLAAAVTSVLDLTLASEASAGFPTQGFGNASSFGLVTVTSSPSVVPLPGAFAMFGGALGLAGWFGWRRKAIGSAPELAPRSGFSLVANA
jgi:hypothetical protein